jgi:oligosaccharyltransferase complex subunit delta (ribophorin II)
LTLKTADTLKIILTTTNGKKPRKPHQAFLTLSEPSTGLEESFPFTVKDSGKSKVDVSFSNIPLQLLKSAKPLEVSIVIGSFGSSTPYKAKAFSLDIAADLNTPLPSAEPQVRYGKQPEIHHIFRSDPKSPPRIITLVFAAGVVACLPVLLGTWLAFGANVNHLGKALGAAPISHALYVGSILAMEGVFFLYYTSWNLFQTLPVAGAIAVVAFYSGSRALTEVQDRRLAGLR